MTFRSCFLGVLLAVAAFAGAAPASAADPSADAEGLITSAETLIKRLDATTAKGNPPTLSNDGAALVRTAYDANVLRAMPLDLGMVSRACVAVGNSIVAYVGFANRSAAGASDRAAVSEARLAQLQAELTAGSVAANLCVQKGFRAVTSFAGTLTADQRANIGGALAQMREGGAQTIASSVETATAETMSVANRAKILSAVLEDLRFAASNFPPAERKALRGRVVAVIPRLPPALAKQAQEIAAVLAGTDCNLICQLAS